jgi:glycosyltransferase involved in cell wall biosynthesis
MRRVLFWGGIASLVYTLFGFPLIALARGVLRRRQPTAATITPLVTIIVSAHNEEAALAAKLDSLLRLDYPTDCVEIVVASDGSADRTNDIAQSYELQGVRLLSLPRLGKAAALNAGVAHASGEVLVFSDANSLFAPQALRALVAPFADPHVGGVAGDQRYLPGSSATGERRYWDFDRMLKLAESRAGHVISATGAIYAIRRELFQPVPDSVTDDFFVSTGVIEQGYRLVFAPEAVAYEPVAESAEVEFGRKVRIMTRGFRAVIARRALLNVRRHGFYSLQLVSHKVLRRLLALPLMAVAAGSVSLWHAGTFYRLATMAQVGFYMAAAAGLLNRDRPLGQRSIFALPAFFCLANSAALVAAANVLRGQRIDRWEPAREAEQAPETDRHLPRSVRSALLPERPDSPDSTSHLEQELRRLRGNPATPPELSVIVPVNAQGDEDNFLRLMGDVARYRGPHTVQIVLVLNNYPDDQPPSSLVRYRSLGITVRAVPDLRRPGYAVALLGRMIGMRAAESDKTLHFDADCRIPFPDDLFNWYADQLDHAWGAYTPVDFHELPSHLSVRFRRRLHHAARWIKRTLGVPTTRGSNYAVQRGAILKLFEQGFIADEMNVGPAIKRAGGRVAYSGSRRHVVLTSGRMFRPGWGRILSYARFRLRYNLRTLPVGSDVAARTQRRDPVRRFIDDRRVS